MHDKDIATDFGDVRAPGRFWSKLKPDPDTGCWNWTASRAWTGYGRLRSGGRGSPVVSAHRYAYLTLVGPIAEGLVVDHLCRTRACCNPAHLRVITQQANITISPISVAGINARKTHCKRGHEFTAENTKRLPGGRRECRECSRLRRRADFVDVAVAS